jgi:hypothetical protein
MFLHHPDPFLHGEFTDPNVQRYNSTYRSVYGTKINTANLNTSGNTG